MYYLLLHPAQVNVINSIKAMQELEIKESDEKNQYTGKLNAMARTESDIKCIFIAGKLNQVIFNGIKLGTGELSDKVEVGKIGFLIDSASDNQNWKTLLRNFRKFNLHFTYSIPLSIESEKSEWQGKVWAAVHSVNYTNELSQEFPIYYFPSSKSILDDC